MTDVQPPAAPENFVRPGLFRAFDGARMRYFDALKVQLRLGEACPGGDIRNLERLLRDLDPPVRADPSQGEGVTESPPTDGGDEPPELLAFARAAAKLEPIVRAGFALAPLDEATGEGLTCLETIDLLNAFLASVGPPGDAGDGAGDPVERADDAESAGP